MIITHIPPFLQVTDSELAAAIGTISPTVGATVTLNCGTPTTQSYSGSDLVDPNSKFYVPYPELVLNFKPEMWGLTEFVDGIYGIQIRVDLSAGGYVQSQNCVFVDITLKCKVAQLIKDVIASGVSTVTHMLHYSLVNGSNCGCNCDELCTNFEVLTEIITDSGLQITNDCGCN